MDDVARAVEALNRERPEFAATLKRMLADPTVQGPLRNDMQVLLQHVIALQLDSLRKSDLALSALDERTMFGVDGPYQVHTLRHIPDVLIRLLCRIAGVPHLTSADSEWLDRMEAIGNDRTKAKDYGPTHGTLK